MEILYVLLALCPVVFIALLLLVWRVPAEIAGILGFLLTVALALTFFDTAFSVVMTVSTAGFVAAFPVSMIFLASLFQITLMQQSGALARVAVFMKCLAPQQQSVQVLLINMGFGVLLTSLGAITVSILPPIMVALGYSAFAAILLPAFGYTAMCMYALLGVPMVVLALFLQMPLPEVGMMVAQYMPLLSLTVGLSMLYITGGMRLIREGFLPALLASLVGGGICIVVPLIGLTTLGGIFAGMGMIAVLLLYTKVCGLPVYTEDALTDAERQVKTQHTLVQAMSPWIVLTVVSLIINMPFFPFFRWVFVTMAMPLEIIPGSPERIRLFWQAYFWVFVTTMLCIPFLKASKQCLATSFQIFIKRAWRVFISATIYFMIAYVMNHSGKNAAWELVAPDKNMIMLLATAATQNFGAAYSLLAPFMGFFAGFVSGTQSSAIAMFTGLQVIAGKALALPAIILGVASAIGGGLSGLVSPAKIQTAAVSIDRGDLLPAVMRTAFVLAIVSILVTSLMTYVFIMKLF